VTGAATLSVALCTHNGERFVRQQLSSIFAQTVLPAEIVISDDASSDDTLAIVAEVTREASATSVTVIVRHNAVALGVVANFELALRATTGEFVVLCDQDDEWMPDRLELILAEFARRPELVLLHGDAELIDANGASLGGTLFQALDIDARMVELAHAGSEWELLLRRNIVTGATTAFRRSLLALALPVPEGWLHDEWLAIVAAATSRIDLTSDRLVRYRQHGTNQVGVRQLSIVGKLRRMLEPGSDRNARLLVRAASLESRLGMLPGLTPERAEAVANKLVHERVRSELGVHRITRVAPVLREYRTGRYARYGRGAADAVRDVLQPLSASS